VITKIAKRGDKAVSTIARLANVGVNEFVLVEKRTGLPKKVSIAPLKLKKNVLNGRFK
jgi:hypothetical protein